MTHEDSSDESVSEKSNDNANIDGKAVLILTNGEPLPVKYSDRMGTIQRRDANDLSQFMIQQD